MNFFRNSFENWSASTSFLQLVQSYHCGIKSIILWDEFISTLEISTYFLLSIHTLFYDFFWNAHVAKQLQLINTL